MTEKTEEQFLAGVLSITREQLNRSLQLNAELEAMLNIEKRKNLDLQNKLEELENKTSEKK
jgi:hypothetical protein